MPQGRSNDSNLHDEILFSTLNNERIGAGVLRLPLALLMVPVSNAAAADVVHVERGDAGMVVSDSAISSRIGRDILLQGVSRQASDIEFTFHGIGEIARGRKATHLRLSTGNDFATENEYVDIDRIEIRSRAEARNQKALPFHAR